MKFGPAIQEDVVNLYNKGIQINEIALKYKTDRTRIYYILKKHNIKPNRLRKFIPNKTFLYSATPESAYFYGFILGDGSVKIDSKYGCYNLTVSIHPKDVTILTMFCKWLHLPGTLIKHRKNTCSITIQDKELVFSEMIKRWGIVPNKTYHPVIPTIDINLLPYFLVGLIDADGSIRFGKKYYFGFVNNPLTVDWVISSFRQLGFVSNIYERQRHSKYCKSIDINKADDIINLSKILKIETNKFCLKRKWGNIQKYLLNPFKLRKDGSNSSKLFIKDIKDIKKLLLQGKSKINISQKYNVSPTTIYYIATGKTWKNI